MPADETANFDQVLRGLESLRDNPPDDPPIDEFFRAMQDVASTYEEQRYRRFLQRLGWADTDAGGEHP